MKKSLSINNPYTFTVATFSTLFGISGLEHGLFEILQGNVRPDGLMISAIGVDTARILTLSPLGN